MGDKIYLVGSNFLTGEAIQQILKKRGYEVYVSSVEVAFEKKKIVDFEPDIMIWQECLIQLRKKSLFELRENCKVSFHSIFILSPDTFSMLGMGLTNGIKGYVHKRGGIKDLEDCINSIKTGSVFISPFLTEATDSPKLTNANNSNVPDVHLTEQEEKILGYVREKKTSREIASILNISPKTVQNHRQNMCNKLGLRGRGRLYEFSQIYL